MSGVLVGLDIGGTMIDVAAVDRTHPELVLAEAACPTEHGPSGLLRSVSTAYQQVVDLLGPSLQVDSIGVGVPGIVSGGAVSHAVNLGLDGHPVDLAGHAAGLLGGTGRVVVENDVTAAVCGAARWLRDTGAGGHDLALLNVGTGLAAGLVLGGQVRRGARGMAGEIGHLVADPAGPPCRCGKRGCLELYASGGGIARTWPGSAGELFAAAAAGDRPAAAATRDALVAGLAQAVRILVQTVDVADVVLTGGVVAATPALREALVAELRDGHADSAFERALAVHERVRWLPEDYRAGAVGAALLVAGSLDLTR